MSVAFGRFRPAAFRPGSLSVGRRDHRPGGGDSLPTSAVNLVANPRLAVGTFGWSAGDDGSPPVRVASSPLGVPAWRYDRVGGSVEVTDNFPQTMLVTPGKTYTLSAWGVVTPGTTVAIDVLWVDGVGASTDGGRAYLRDEVLTGDLGSPTVQAAVGVPTRWSRTTTAPAGTVSAIVRCFRDAGGDGLTYASRFMFSEVLVPYADGDSPGWYWLGTPHQSSSWGRV